MATKLSRRTVILSIIAAIAMTAVVAWDLALVAAGEPLAAHPLHTLAAVSAILLAAMASHSFMGDRIIAHVERRYQQIRTGMVGLGARIPATGEWPKVSIDTDAAMLQGFDLGARVRSLEDHRVQKR